MFLVVVMVHHQCHHVGKRTDDTIAIATAAVCREEDKAPPPSPTRCSLCVFVDVSLCVSWYSERERDRDNRKQQETTRDNTRQHETTRDNTRQNETKRNKTRHRETKRDNERQRETQTWKERQRD